MRGDGEPAAAVLHVVFEDEAVEDAAVDEGDGDLLVVVVIVAGDEVPSASRNVLVDAGNRRLPVFFPVKGAIDALATVEPVGGTKGSAQAEEEVGSHFLTEFNGDWLLVGLVSLVTMSTKRKKSRSQIKRRELVVQTSSDLAITDGRPTEGVEVISQRP